MKSYATIDRIERKYAVCEVELQETVNSNSENYFEHPIAIMLVPVENIRAAVGEIDEDDILIVEHDCVECVSQVYNKSEEEMLRRGEVLDRIMRG